SEEIASLDSALFQNKKQRDELYQYIENNFEDYYEMKYANSMLSIDEVRQKLKNNEVIIEYVLNENEIVPELYAFFISADEYGFYNLYCDTTLIPSLEEVFRFLSSQTYLYTKNSNSKTYSV